MTSVLARSSHTSQSTQNPKCTSQSTQLTSRFSFWNWCSFHYTYFSPWNLRSSVKRERNHLKDLKVLASKIAQAKAIIWPWLSYLCRIRLTADLIHTNGAERHALLIFRISRRRICLQSISPSERPNPKHAFHFEVLVFKLMLVPFHLF